MKEIGDSVKHGIPKTPLDLAEIPLCSLKQWKLPLTHYIKPYGCGYPTGYGYPTGSGYLADCGYRKDRQIRNAL